MTITSSIFIPSISTNLAPMMSLFFWFDRGAPEEFLDDNGPDLRPNKHSNNQCIFCLQHPKRISLQVLQIGANKTRTNSTFTAIQNYRQAMIICCPVLVLFCNVLFANSQAATSPLNWIWLTSALEKYTACCFNCRKICFLVCCNLVAADVIISSSYASRAAGNVDTYARRRGARPTVGLFSWWIIKLCYVIRLTTI